MDCTICGGENTFIRSDKKPECRDCDSIFDPKADTSHLGKSTPRGTPDPETIKTLSRCPLGMPGCAVSDTHDHDAADWRSMVMVLLGVEDHDATGLTCPACESTNVEFNEAPSMAGHGTDWGLKCRACGHSESGAPDVS